MSNDSTVVIHSRNNHGFLNASEGMASGFNRKEGSHPYILYGTI